MIDYQSEQLVTLNDAPKHIPGRPHYSTVFRWVSRGSRGVTLETILIGGKRMTSLEALQRFFEATTAAADGKAQPEPSLSLKRQKEIEAAERECAALGL